MARHFRNSGHILRFIEYMDVGTTNGWRMEDVVSAKEILATLSREWAMEPVEPNYFGEVAERYRYIDGAGEVGIIASVTRAVLRRLHARPALGRRRALHLPLRRQGPRPAQAPARRQQRRRVCEAAVRDIWGNRTDRYSEIRSEDTISLHKVEMSKIGG